ncbi:hypothetical protein GTP91_27275 [Rugamonas sp. FT82W]|uniref:Uncharacterized protein n=1 Tax=Duganella vulcania TaxID=2692166 RepID=A0A845G844_9BURK|nr:hypothetical protein [Duganella vulcania]MYM90863.1 hypothetical protein [Duganella vulcania]
MNGAYPQLLLQVVRDGCSSRMLMRISAMLLALAVAIPVVAHVFERPEIVAPVLAGSISFLVVIWCGSFLNSAVQQNHPAYACLVPRLRRRLIVLTLALYFAACLLIAAVVAVAFGHFGYALAGAAVFFCYMLYAQRYTALALLPSILIVASVSVLNAPLHALWESMRLMGEPALTGIGLAAAAVLGALGVQLVFPRGGDRHWSWHARQAARLRRMRGGAPKPGESTGWSRWIMRLQVGYRAALRRDSRGGGTQGGMLLHSFGPAAHEGGYHAYLLLVTLVVVLLVLSAGADMQVLRQMMRTSLTQASVMVAVVLYAAELRKSATRRAAEQALYLLTPGAPAAAQLNRVLGKQLLTRFLRVWLVAALCVAVLDTVMLGAPRLYGPTFVLCALLLGLSCTLLRNYAATPASSNQTAPVVATLLATAVYLIVLSVDRWIPSFPLFWLGAAIVPASLLALRRRWLRLMSLPAVLPAGRLLA